MENTVVNATEYRDLALGSLRETLHKFQPSTLLG
jgi:hypothetical protein